MIHLSTINLFALALIITMIKFEAGYAQEGTRGSVARIVYLEDISNDRPTNLSGALESLRQETQRLQKTLSADATATPVSQPRTTYERLPPPESVAPSTMEEIQPAAGVGGTSDIYERIELLKRIYEQREFDARAASVQPAAAEAPPALEELPLPTPVQERPTPKNMSEIGSQFAAAATAAPTSNAQRAVSAPVDLFELGNSLYQTGNLLTALDAYVQVDRSTITAAEAVWLDFMIASCHRRMGNWDDASRLYREVANQNDAPYLTKPAQSWLKQVELASKSKTEYSDIENQINLLLEKGQTNVTK